MLPSKLRAVLQGNITNPANFVSYKSLKFNSLKILIRIIRLPEDFLAADLGSNLSVKLLELGFLLAEFHEVGFL